MKPCVIRKPAKTNIIYTGAFVNTNLTKEYSSDLPNKFGHHMTVSFKPSDLNVPVGENTDLKIIGRLTTDKVDVLIIDNELSTNEFPHITLATAEGVKPFASNTEIKNNQDKIVPLDTTINATYGYFDGKNDVTKIPTGTIQVTAPNGKPSKLFNDLTKFLGDEELALKAWARTYTKEFQEWFKDSKVVDENGEPKLVFLNEKNTNSNVFAFTDKMGNFPMFVDIKNPETVKSVKPTKKGKQVLKENEALKSKYFQDGDVQSHTTILQRIIDNNHALAPLARKLLLISSGEIEVTLVNAPWIEVDEYSTGIEGQTSNKAGATYSGGKIKMPSKSNYRNDDPVPTLLHEILHGYTADQINKNTLATRKLKKIYESALKQSDFFTEDYPLVNLKEFIVGVYTNPQFIIELQQLPSIGNNENLWEDLLKTFKRMFGFTKKQASLFDDAFSISNRIIADYGQDTKQFQEETSQWTDFSDAELEQLALQQEQSEEILPSKLQIPITEHLSNLGEEYSKLNDKKDEDNTPYQIQSIEAKDPMSYGLSQFDMDLIASKEAELDKLNNDIKESKDNISSLLDSKDLDTQLSIIENIEISNRRGIVEQFLPPWYGEDFSKDSSFPIKDVVEGFFISEFEDYIIKTSDNKYYRVGSSMLENISKDFYDKATHDEDLSKSANLDGLDDSIIPLNFRKFIKSLDTDNKFSEEEIDTLVDLYESSDSINKTLANNIIKSRLEEKIETPTEYVNPKVPNDKDGVITEDGDYVVGDPDKAKSILDEFYDHEEETDQESEETQNNFNPEDIISNFEKAKEFKQSQLIQMRNRLNRIKSVKKELEKDLGNPKKLKQFKKLSKLQIEVENRIGSKAQNKGLVSEVSELQSNSSLYSIQEMAANDFNRLEFILNKKRSNLLELEEANGIISFYDNMKPDSDKEHSLFSQEQLFDSYGNENYNKLPYEVFEYMKELSNNANKYRNVLETKKKNFVTALINSNSKVKNLHNHSKLTYDDIIHKKEGLKDTHWVDKMVMDVTMGIFSDNGVIPQTVFSFVQEHEDKKLLESKKLQEELDLMQPKVEKALQDEGQEIGFLNQSGVSYDMFKQINSLGLETGKIVHRYSTDFFESKQAMHNTFEVKLNLAKKQKNPNKKKQLFEQAFAYNRYWHRKNTIQLNLGQLPEIIGNKEFAEFSTYFDENGSKEHVKSLKNTISKTGYDEEVAKQIKILRRYVTQRKTYQEMVESKSLSEQDFIKWKKMNNPFIANSYYYTDNKFEIDSEFIVPTMEYNISIPRKKEVTIDVDDNTNKISFAESKKDLGFYDEKFKIIEQNKDLYEYQKLLTKALKQIRKGFPAEIQNNISINSIIGVEQSVTEMLMRSESFGDKFSKIRSRWWQKFKDIFSIKPQSRFSKAEINPATGKANYTVNAEFIKENQSKIQSISYIAQIELSKALGIDEITKFTKIKQNTKEVQKTVTFLNNKRNKLKKALKTADAFDKEIISEEISGIDKSLSKIITYEKLAKNEKAIRIIAEQLGISPNINAIKKRLKGKDINLLQFLNDTATHQVVQSHSFDLPKVMKMYLDLSAKYQAKEEVKPMVDLLKDSYEKIQTPNTQNTGDNIVNADGNSQQNGLRTGGIDQMDSYYRRNILMNQGGEHFGKFEDLEYKYEENSIKRALKTIIGIFSGQSSKNLTTEEKEQYIKIDKLLKTETDPEIIERLTKMKNSLGRVYTTEGLVNGILTFTRLRQLGYSLSSATTNLMEGELSNLMMVSLGFVKPDNYWRANKIARGSFVKNLSSGKFKTKEAQKLSVLMGKLDIVQDSTNELQKSSAKSSISKWGQKLSPYELNKRTEFLIQSKIVSARLMDQEIFDINNNKSNVWDALDVNGKLQSRFRTPENIQNWEDMTGKTFLGWSGKTEGIINLAHGNYSERRGMLAKENAFGKTILLFKTWLPMAIASRYAIEQNNYILGVKNFKGRYRSFTTVGAGVSGAVAGFALLSAFTNPLFGILFGAGSAMAAASHFNREAYNVSKVKTDMGIFEELYFSTKMLTFKAIGMPINRLFGKEVEWVKKLSGDYSNKVDASNPNFTEQDARNMNANITEMALMVQRLMLMVLIKAALWDDDDEEEDRPAYNVMMNKLQQMNQNLLSFTFSKDAYKNLTTSGAMKTLDDARKVFKAGTDMITLIPGAKGDVKLDGPNRGPDSVFWGEVKKMFLPGVFKDIDISKPYAGLNTAGLGTQMERQFQPDPFEIFFDPEMKSQRRDVRRRKLLYEMELRKQGFNEYVAKRKANAKFAKEMKKTRDRKKTLQKRKKKMTTYFDKYGNEIKD
mgnify:FL=1